MSIIEKAIGALGKNKEDEGSEAPDRASDVASPAAHPGDTVQRANEAQQSPDRGSTAPVAPRGAGVTAAPPPGEGVTIPFRELRKLGFLTPTTPRSAIAEQFRTIKRPLLVNIAGDSVTPPIPHGNLIMVTSALEGDGKTFTAICLALSIAMEQDKHVLFVDGDTAKAEAGKTLGVSRDSRGLIDLLENRSARTEDYILDTNMEKLRILPAGSVHSHANELLASSRAQELILELAEADPSRVIVFDSPPMLLTTEAAILASFMGQIVFVVSADQTPQHAVTQAIEHIGEDKMVGMVLNRARRGRNPYIYSYGNTDNPYGYANRSDEQAAEPEN
jgi:exopolysaccharide/PEP-CTERM locus tyrosine autokinase